MPGPYLRLDAAVETLVFRALVAILQDDPILRGVVKTWEVLDGNESSVQPPATAMMPWVRLLPGPSPLSIAEAGAYQIDLTVYASIATKGLHADDQLNLWGAFRRALNYERPSRDSTVAGHLGVAGCFLHQIASPGFGPFPMPTPANPSPAQDLIGSARVLLKCRVDF